MRGLLSPQHRALNTVLTASEFPVLRRAGELAFPAYITLSFAVCQRCCAAGRWRGRGRRRYQSPVSGTDLIVWFNWEAIR